MRTIELARKMAEYGQKKDAQKAYFLALGEAKDKEPKEELEAASYLFFSKWDHRTPFSTFVSLYNRGFFQAELMDLMLQAFYLPNIQKQKRCYERNCAALAKYPYFFRQDFPAFDDLPITFFPFDDKGFVPFIKSENRFGDYVDCNDPVIDRYFFKDLENPILAKDVYSQYQLEYLNDNVRKSEWVGKENHIYLHYTNWAQFCAYLQCIDLRNLLRGEKLIFLIEDEIDQYPIDFKARFGIDYSQYPVKPIGIQEINRLIWHTQLSAHNGGDFFNEIFYGHPNLLVIDSLMFDSVLDTIKEQRKTVKDGYIPTTSIQRELAQIPHPTDKDHLVAIFLNSDDVSGDMSGNSRIVPALFFQPHFHNIRYNAKLDEAMEHAVLYSEQYEKIRKSPVFQQFKYIKTFTPMRRITTSYGATVRFMLRGIREEVGDRVVPDAFTERLLNRSFMVDRWDRLYRDSVLVRFEDGKLNPKATFTALAEFLDIPYTESMTYCSNKAGINPQSMQGNDVGFDTGAIYRTYDEYVDDDDRCLLEYFFRDAYETYGYDFKYYHGEPVDMEWVREKLKGFHNLDHIILESHKDYISKHLGDKVALRELSEEAATSEKSADEIADARLRGFAENRERVTENLLKGLEFINRQGQPLQMMKRLELDPELLEQPLYH